MQVPTTTTTTTTTGVSGSKPILKTETHHQGPPSPERNKSLVGEGVSSSNKSNRHLTWDEHAIEEHNELRGTRMKIDEPNTPYTHYDHHSDDEESNSSGHRPRSPDETHPKNMTPNTNILATQWGDISSKLQAVADRREAAEPLIQSPSRDSTMSDGDGADSEDEAKKRKFKDMRKKHYNEAEAMRRWKAEHANDDDDEEEDDSDDDDDKMET